MSDDPNKTGRDRRTVSDQDHELRHVYGVLEDEFPDADRSTIADIVTQVKKDIAPSTDRAKIMEAARKALRS